MKLLSVTARANLIGVVVILILSASILFVVLRLVTLEELQEQLTLKAQRIEEAISTGHEFYDPFSTIKKVESPTGEVVDIFSDTLIFDDAQDEFEDYRMLETTRQINGNWYQIKTSTSRVEWEEFLWIIFTVFLGSSILLLFTMQWVNQKLTRRILTPFFNNLKKIQSFSLNSGESLQLESSDVQEFRELNEVLIKMTSKIHDDYSALKDFSENASHEIQTPLAIILSGLDQLGQGPALDEASAGKIEIVRNAASRLSKLNRNLLLLTKIENAQFSQVQSVDLVALLKQQITMMEDLFDTKGISLQVDLPKEMVVQANPNLTEILLSNLLSNGYRYTPGQSVFHISSTERSITFSNSGEPFDVNSSKLFERFYKGSAVTNSNGLGLSIVAKICATYNWKVDYQYSESSHHFTLSI